MSKTTEIERAAKVYLRILWAVEHATFLERMPISSHDLSVRSWEQAASLAWGGMLMSEDSALHARFFQITQAMHQKMQAAIKAAADAKGAR